MSSRTLNATRNVIWGTTFKIVSIFFPFVIKTVILYTLGTEYLGLNGLFRSILNVLNLANLGIGSALIYSMYKPMAENDTETLSVLLKFYRDCYRVIGTIVLVIGLAIMPFIENLVKGDYPSGLNLYILYGIYLLNSVLSYFLFSYRRSLLTASQRGDVESKICTVTHLLLYFFQIVFLVLTKNYYIYLLLMPITTIISNILNAIVTNKFFPDIHCKGSMPKEQIFGLKKRVTGLIFNKIGRVVLTSVDSVVVSAFLGLVPLAMYGNYYYIIFAIIGIFTTIVNALTPSIGNSIVKESIDKNYEHFKQFTFMYGWIVTWCTTCFLCLIQQFMSMWMGDDLLFSLPIVFMFTVYLYVWGTNDIANAFKSALGLWWEGRFIPIIASLLNVCLNLLLVNVLEIKGILLSTIVAFVFVYIPWSSYILFKYYFGNLKRWFLYLYVQIAFFAVSFVVAGATYLICGLLKNNGLITFIERGIICLIVPNVLLLICFFWTKEFKRSCDMFKFYLKKKMQRR